MLAQSQECCRRGLTLAKTGKFFVETDHTITHLGCRTAFSLFPATEESDHAQPNATRKQPGEYLFTSRRTCRISLTTRQYARLVSEWIAGIGLDPLQFGTHSLRRTKATLIYKRTGNLRNRPTSSRSHKD